jgi:hypothetical protein
MFQDNAISANRDAVTNDLVNLSARAQQYYRRPTALGGGQGDFSAIVLGDLTTKPTNANGSYALTSKTASQVVLDGTGTEDGDDGSPISVTMTVLADSTYVVFNN